MTAFMPKLNRLQFSFPVWQTPPKNCQTHAHTQFASFILKNLCKRAARAVWQFVPYGGRQFWKTAALRGSWALRFRSKKGPSNDIHRKAGRGRERERTPPMEPTPYPDIRRQGLRLQLDNHLRKLCAPTERGMPRLQPILPYHTPPLATVR
jgi:hypothetical protein